jgi:hypothetical protein
VPSSYRCDGVLLPNIHHGVHGTPSYRLMGELAVKSSSIHPSDTTFIDFIYLELIQSIVSLQPDLAHAGQVNEQIRLSY